MEKNIFPNAVTRNTRLQDLVDGASLQNLIVAGF
jgi:hypothetical protein